MNAVEARPTPRFQRRRIERSNAVEASPKISNVSQVLTHAAALGLTTTRAAARQALARAQGNVEQAVYLVLNECTAAQARKETALKRRRSRAA